MPDIIPDVIHRKRTAVLLTTIGLMGSLLGMVFVAFPFYVIFGALSHMDCAESCAEEIRATNVVGCEAVVISILISVASFLPRILYGRATAKEIRRAKMATKEDMGTVQYGKK